jgi:hypothetical protein
MTNNLIQFPRRAPFDVNVTEDDDGWLVVCRSHGWLHADRREAIEDAREIARGFGVVVEARQ